MEDDSVKRPGLTHTSREVTAAVRHAEARVRQGGRRGGHLSLLATRRGVIIRAGRKRSENGKRAVGARARHIT